MEATLREYLKNNYNPEPEDDEVELFFNIVGDYYSSKGMEWTADDEAVIREYGHDPQDFLNFDEDQLSRLDDIQEATVEFCRQMILFPSGSVQNKENEEITDDLYNAKIWCRIAEFAAEILHNNGFSVHFPTHVEVGDESGTEYIADEWEG